MTTIFGKIIKGELPCEKVYEDDLVFAFKDIHPKAPVHLLICPKKEISDLQSVSEEDLKLMPHLIKTAQLLAKKFGVENGYRLIVNNGPASGQTVAHLHFHLIGGKTLGGMA
jgi:histidine triad (HIT) family protein